MNPFLKTGYENSIRGDEEFLNTFYIKLRNKIKRIQNEKDIEIKVQDTKEVLDALNILLNWIKPSNIELMKIFLYLSSEINKGIIDDIHYKNALAVLEVWLE
jgi:uncharacterized protein YeeX (DUF496 family)